MRFSLFILAGTLSSIVSLLARCGFSLVVPYEAAVVLAQIVGVLVAFSLNRLFVFQQSQRAIASALPRFFLVNVMSLIIVTTISSLCYRLILPALSIQFHPGIISQVAGLAASALPGFFAHKYFSFSMQKTK
jgi:putative flippase GtrA